MPKGRAQDDERPWQYLGMAGTKKARTTTFRDWITVLDAEGWMVRVKVEELNGLPEIVGLHVEAIPDRGFTGLPPTHELLRRVPLTSELVRRLPLRQLKQAAVSAMRADDDWLKKLHAAPKGGPMVRPKEHYEVVAAIYTANLVRGPLAAVQREFGVSRAGASKYVRRAREMGLLGWPERKGLPGTSGAASPYEAESKSTKSKGSRREAK